MYIPAIHYLFILPFAGIYTLVWAFLSELGIFKTNRNVNRVLAFIITFLTIPVGIFIKIVWVLFSFIGVWSAAVFAITFIIGIFFKGAGIAAREYYTYKRMGGPLKEIAENFEKYANEKIKAIPEGAELTALRRLRDEIKSKIYLGEITKLDDAKKQFDEAYNRITSRG